MIAADPAVFPVHYILLATAETEDPTSTITWNISLTFQMKNNLTGWIIHMKQHKDTDLSLGRSDQIECLNERVGELWRNIHRRPLDQRQG